MKTEMMNFNFNNNAIRTIMTNDGVWFVGKDVCTVLEITNVTQALSRLDEDETQVIDLSTLCSNDGNKINILGEHKINIINESGLYSLVLGSRKPEAKVFKKWVTSEVLPQIRKTGAYSKPMSIGEMLVYQAQQYLKIEQEQERQRIEQDRQADRVARIEAKQLAYEDGYKYFTVMGYVVMKALPAIDLNTASRIGKLATKLSNSAGMLVSKVKDVRFGVVNAYHEDILQQAIS